jgi:hypothetical protein
LEKLIDAFGNALQAGENTASTSDLHDDDSQVGIAQDSIKKAAFNESDKLNLISNNIENSFSKRNLALYPDDSYKLSGYLGYSMHNNEGYAVKLINVNGLTETVLKSGTTNNEGYFEITFLPAASGSYKIEITKPGYLKRVVTDVSLLTTDIRIYSISLWPGDVQQDGAINMSDVIEISSCFNVSSSNTSRYKSEYDLNNDNSINMADVMIVTENFNKGTKDYLEGIPTYQVSQDMTLSPDNVPSVINGSLIIDEGKCLTILPGTNLKFKNGSIIVDGRIIALGTPESNIVFTSIDDQKYGGTGYSGNYGCNSIVIGSTGLFSGNYVDFRYGGRGNTGDDGFYVMGQILTYDGTLDLNNSSLSYSNGNSIVIKNTNPNNPIGNNISIMNCRIENYQNDGIVIVDNGNGQFVIENNTIINGNTQKTYNSDNFMSVVGSSNGISVSGSGNSLSIKNNSISGNYGFPIVFDRVKELYKIDMRNISGNCFTQNALNSIVIGDGLYEVEINKDKTITLTNNNESYVILGKLKVYGTLNIEEGVKLYYSKTTNNKSLYENIPTYSFIDVYGKLNSYGTASNPVVITNVNNPVYGIISKDSDTYSELIYVNAYPTENMVGELNTTYTKIIGASIIIGGKANIKGCTITNSISYNKIISESELIISFNNIFGNLSCSGEVQLDAGYNYWVSESGPKYKNSLVNYDPWFREPIKDGLVTLYKDGEKKDVDIDQATHYMDNGWLPTIVQGTGEDTTQTPSNPFGDKWFISADEASAFGLTTPSSNNSMSKELEGFGIQVEISGSIPGFTGALGAEIVWYTNDSFERDKAGLYTNKSEAIPYIYVFIEGDTGASMTKRGVDYLIASLKDIAKSPDVALKNINNLAGFSASVTAFGIVGNNRFNNPYDYLGAFNTTSATVYHVKGTYASDPNNNVVTVGVGADTSYFGFFQGASNYYLLNPSKLEEIANSLSSLMGTASNEYKAAAQ